MNILYEVLIYWNSHNFDSVNDNIEKELDHITLSLETESDESSMGGPCHGPYVQILFRDKELAIETEKKILDMLKKYRVKIV